MKQKEISEIIEFVENDIRSKGKIFESLKQRIQDDYNGRLSEKEAIEATERFIGFFELIDSMYDDKIKKPIED